jgi:hypothetical protein
MSLHDDIMNLQVPQRRELITCSGQGELAYKYGHRDARHAAAELAIQAESWLEAYSDMIRKICFEYGAGGYNSEGLLPVEVAERKLRWIIEDVRQATIWQYANKQKNEQNEQ